VVKALVTSFFTLLHIDDHVTVIAVFRPDTLFFITSTRR
jgi:hypothetical protein